MTVNDYHSLRVIAMYGPYDEDDDATLHLCDDCVMRHADQLAYAGDGEAGDACEFCDVVNGEDE